MHPSRVALLGVFALPLAACGGANLKSAGAQKGSPAPPVEHPYYDPYMPHGRANATWVPPVWDRVGTVVKPADPGVERGRPAYEMAPWATGAAGGRVPAPPGTF